MTVLGFGGLLDSESYMPSGVSLKVVDLIGCIRVCVCALQWPCAWMYVCACLHNGLSVCMQTKLYSKSPFFQIWSRKCMLDMHWVCVFVSVCACVYAHIWPFFALSVKGSNSGLQWIAFSFYSCHTWPNCANLFYSHLLLLSLSVQLSALRNTKYGPYVALLRCNYNFLSVDPLMISAFKWQARRSNYCRQHEVEKKKESVLLSSTGITLKPAALTWNQRPFARRRGDGKGGNDSERK